MKALNWINCILGLWLIVAGFVLSTGNAAVMTEEIVLGLFIGVLSALSTVALSPLPSWLVALAGVWTALAPSVITYGRLSVSRADDVIVGIVVMILATVTALHPTRVPTV